MSEGNCPVFCDLGPNCSALVLQSYTSWQCRPSTPYMTCLFYSFNLQFRTSVSKFLLSSILHMWPNSRSFSEWLFVVDPFQFWVCHIFHGLFFTLCNSYVGFFGSSTSQCQQTGCVTCLFSVDVLLILILVNNSKPEQCEKPCSEIISTDFRMLNNIQSNVYRGIQCRFCRITFDSVLIGFSFQFSLSWIVRTWSCVLVDGS